MHRGATDSMGLMAWRAQLAAVARSHHSVLTYGLDCASYSRCYKRTTWHSARVFVAGRSQDPSLGSNTRYPDSTLDRICTLSDVILKIKVNGYIRIIIHRERGYNNNNNNNNNNNTERGYIIRRRRRRIIHTERGYIRRRRIIHTERGYTIIIKRIYKKKKKKNYTHRTRIHNNNKEDI